MTSAAWDAWVERARQIDIAEFAAKRDLKLKCVGKRSVWPLVGPCPQCGGDDRFAISITKAAFNCRGCKKAGDVIALAQLIDGCDFVRACETLTGESPPPEEKLEPKKKPNGGGGEWKLVREHIYKTADGAPHLRKQKKIDPKGERQFPQHHWDGAKWVSGVPKDWPKILYRLPELLKAPEGAIVYLVEGEGDADSLAALEFTATTPGGVTSKWTPELAAPLKDRRVVILVDSDRPGRDYGERVARLLDPIAASIKIIDLFTDRADGSDVTDFLATDRAGAKFAKLVREAPEWEPSAEPERTSESETDDDALITELARMPALQYERERKKAAERLGVRAPILDRLVSAERAKLGLVEADDGKQGRAISFAEPEPWPDKVNGTALLDAIAAAVGSHVVMSEHQRVVGTLWAVHPHLIDRFLVSPRLAICSPVKQCGKTTLLDVLARLVSRPLPTANVSPAAVFRVVEEHRPTLLVDEADTFLRENDELRGIVNSGHRRGGSVLRTVGDDHEVRSFSTYSACAIAAIGRLPDTLHDRAVVIDLKRRLASEKITPFRIDRTQHLDDLARQIARWTQDNAERIAAADPAMPTGVYNRAADNWRPLLAIAEAAGGEWPERARKAAASAAETAGEASRLEILLGDIRTIFTNREVDRIPSADLVAGLIATEGRPWAEYGKTGKPITQNKLAYLLKPLGIAPERIRILDLDGKEIQVRGYVEERFQEAFARFLPDLGPSNRHNVPNTDEQGTSDLFQTVTTESDVTVRKCEKSNNDGDCDVVTVEKGESGEERHVEPSDAPDLPPGSELVGRAPAGERCYLCGKAGRVFLVRRRGGIDRLHPECAKAEPGAAGNSAEPGIPQHVIRKWAAWYADESADQYHATGEVDRAQLDAELRRRLAEEEHVYPEFIEVEFNRIID